MGLAGHLGEDPAQRVGTAALTGAYSGPGLIGEQQLPERWAIQVAYSLIVGSGAVAKSVRWHATGRLGTGEVLDDIWRICTAMSIPVELFVCNPEQLFC